MRKLLHKNLLLPFMALPASKQNPLVSSMSFESSQPLPGETNSLHDMTETGDLADTSSVEEVNSVPTPDAEEKQASPVVPKYVCPQRRSKLNPLAEPFHPGSKRVTGLDFSVHEMNVPFILKVLKVPFLYFTSLK